MPATPSLFEAEPAASDAMNVPCSTVSWWTSRELSIALYVSGCFAAMSAYHVGAGVDDRDPDGQGRPYDAVRYAVGAGQRAQAPIRAAGHRRGREPRLDERAARDRRLDEVDAALAGDVGCE